MLYTFAAAATSCCQGKTPWSCHIQRRIGFFDLSLKPNRDRERSFGEFHPVCSAGFCRRGWQSSKYCAKIVDRERGDPVTDNLVDIGTWLDELGLGQYRSLFAEHEIDREVLPELTEDDLERFGMPLGHRRRLRTAITELAAMRSAAAGGDHAMPLGLDAPLSRRSNGSIRQLTVMFCDLVGSTALAGRLDPEDFHDIIRTYFETCYGVIAASGGYVARLLGDGLLIYFGYPHAQEDAVERAARVGLQLVAAVSNLRPRPDIVLSAHIGVATGLVVVGDLPGELPGQEGAVTGDAPNLAAQLQALAKPDTVVVSDVTKRLLGQLFEFEDLGLHELKGRAVPMQAWRVVAERNVDNRFEAIRPASRGTLLGRDTEVALLLDRWRSAQAGEGQVVLLSGPAGIGKSRIAAALVARLKDEPHMLVRFQCSPFHVNTSLHPALVQLEHAAGIEPNQPPETRLERLANLLARTGRDEPTSLPLFATLLSIGGAERDSLPILAPHELMRRSLDALAAWLLAMARRQPVLFIVEDAHWIDPTTRELVALCIDRIETAPVLALITHRPEFLHSWTDHAHVTSLTLNRLGRQQTAGMISQIAGGKELPPEVLGQIAAKADGVPLFIEELTMAVLQSKSLREEADRYVLTGDLGALAIPATLQDALLARLDRLPPMKEVAQTAAVIGREFSYPLLAAVAPYRGAALETALVQLAREEVICERITPSQRIYTFKHSLLRDAAYSTLPRGKRRELHARVAHVLEEQSCEVAERQPEVLAHHFTAAGLAGPAVDWWEKASEHALARSANLEAANHLAQALEMLATQPESVDRDKREFQLRLRLRPPLYATKGFASPEMEGNFARASMLAERLGESGTNLRLLRWECTSSVVSANTTATLNHTRQFIGLAERAGDTSALVSGHRICGYAHLIRGEIRVAREHVERALSLREAPCENRQLAEYEFLSEPMTRCIMGLAVQQLGYPDQALNICENALAAAKQAGHQIEIAYVSFHLALLCMVSGDATRVERIVTKLVEFLEQQDIQYWKWHCETLLGWATVKADSIDVDAGLARMRLGAAGHHSLRVNAWMPFYLTREAEILSLYRRYDTAILRLDEAKALMGQLEQFYAEPELHRLRAVTLSAQGAAGRETDAAFEQALDAARRHETKLWELRAATSCAEFWREGGRRRQARDLLEPVYGWFTEGFGTLDLKQAKAVLESLT
jgi:class 3 adenylate cyclase/tetratricopeptide (TPR) repeat protein